MKTNMEIQNKNEIMDGTILSIHVKNFFCHVNFKVEFKKRVTFIIGRNGSGKSAILTALVVGLGGKALETNRGKNFQSFIKNGANSASVEIKIKNSGPQAYKHEEYGDVITIVKTISISGTSSYKIKLVSGQLVPTTARVVNAIVLAHNIQVNNPISVLNQDDARDFIQKLEPRKLYALFTRATNLDITEKNYEKGLTFCNNADVSWEKQNKICNDLKNEYKKWQDLHNQMQSRKEVVKALKMLRIELKWTEIAKVERELSDIRKQYDKRSAKCDELAKTIDSMEQNSANAATEALKRRLVESNVEKERLQQQVRERQSGWREAREARDASGAGAARLRERLKREENNILTYKQEIRNIESGEMASQRAELQRRAERSRAAAEAARARYGTRQSDAQHAYSHAAHAAGAEAAARDDCRRHADRITQLEQQLRTLEAGGADSLAVYGANVRELCRRVREHTERGAFSAPPRGPVGHYLKVNDKKWAGVLEHIIGGAIRTFCVNTSEDLRKLFEIMNTINWSREPKPMVTCSKFLRAQHDVSRATVRAGAHRSALDALLVSDPVVANFLIDNHALESVLLVPDDKTAMKLSESEANVPRHCSKIVTLECSEYYPAPHYRCYGGAPAPRRYLQTSTGERKLQLQNEIQELKNNLQIQKANIQKLSAELQVAKNRENEAASALQAMGAELQRCEAGERAAVAELDMLPAPRRDVLIDELKVSEEEVEKLREQLRVLTDKEEHYKRELDSYDIQTRDLKTKLVETNEICSKLSEEIDQMDLKVHQKISLRKNMQKELTEERKKLAQAKDCHDKQAAAVAAKISSTPGSRIENPRDKTVITNLMAEKERKVNSMVETNLSREVVERERDAAEQNYRRTHALLRELRTLIDRIKKMAADHLKYCCKLKNDIGRGVNVLFMETLRKRGYYGQMLIDHKEETLALVGSGGSRSASSTASLSGGERSYTSVAFITALWECVGLPFYFMDEFDVFMDEVNQHRAVKLLLDKAKERREHQFVFLTPHGANIELQDMATLVDVISLDDPVRQ